MINYSFIIPHKNIPKLLVRCVESIPKRNDIEIIIIDDNSDPICDLQSLECLQNKNVIFLGLDKSYGAGYARNEGIKIAKGKWLLFADSDDYYTNEIDRVLDQYKEDNCTDIVYLNAQSINENGVTSFLPISRYIDNFNKNRFYSEKSLRFANWVPWTRMVKRDMVIKHDIRYEEIPVGNDAIFCLKCSKYANIIAAESSVVYFYYKPSAGSCTYHYYKISNLNSMIDLRFRINSLYSDVSYIFKQNFIKGLFVNRKDKEYISAYKAALKRNRYSLIIDLYNTIIYCLGKMFRLI